MAHRGPDARGIWIDNEARLGLGHRRLSILDLSDAGVQPMSYQGRYVGVFNGEIYNFLELRERLEGLGHVFDNETDTGVLLAAYAQWGPDCQLEFNGMWGFAVWDRLERTLFLSRDRFGVKPAYWTFDGRAFAFASELKAFLALPWLSGQINQEHMRRVSENPAADELGEPTLLEGVRRLRGGHCLMLRLGGAPKVWRWWRTADHLPEVPRTWKAQTNRFRDLFLDSVRLRLRSDTAVGTALSGGMDSGAVLSSMALIMERGGERLQDDWQKAFIGVYANTAHDETAFALDVVERIGGRARLVTARPPTGPEGVDAIILQMEAVYYEIPFGPWQIYQAMRSDGVYVTLDGHGGDELLGGYHHHLTPAMAEAWAAGKPRSLARLRRLLSRMCVPGRSPDQPSDEVVKSGRGFHYEGFPCPTDAEEAKALGSFDRLTRELYLDLHFITLPSILRNFDRMSMGHGVECRAPFLDWRLVTYGLALPLTAKIGGGFTKRVLRAAMAGLMPDSVRLRMEKVGFGHPHSQWLAGPLNAYVLGLVEEADFKACGYFDALAVRQAVLTARDTGDWQPIASLGMERRIMAYRLPALFAALRSRAMRSIGASGAA
jgi:asparagine synthase (glutamine-hydrolysing)